jgi:hypothetical protein
MKKITKFFMLIAAIVASVNAAKAVESTFCQTTVTHFNIPAETASGIKLTISKIDATSMYVEIESATSDPVDLLLVNGGSGATISAADASVAGKLKRTLTWTTAPTNVSIELLWSKVTMGGNWMINTFSVPFDATCSGGTSTPDTEIPTAFTATKGAVTANSVELLLKATDNSGSINYTITYGATVLQTVGLSNVEKSYIVTGLTAATAYNFSITAKDAANNAAANNPLPVSATTSAAPVLSTINFETVGHDWTWTKFGFNVANETEYSVAANPVNTGINTSSSAGKYIVYPNSQTWAGLWSDGLVDFTFTADNCIVKVMVYKDVISNFDVKFEGAGGLNFEKLVPNTKINEWEELTFDFSNRIGSTVTRLVIIPDFPGARTAGSVNYFDNISFNSSSAPVVVTDPTVAAPTPTTPSNKVISLFSNAYTNVTVDTWRTGWSNASLEAVQVAGNDVKKYTNLVFVGVETAGANMIDATTMTHLHLDVWTPDVTTFKVKLVDFGANAAWSGGDDVEHELTFSPTASTWNSYNIPLSDFTNLTTRAHMAQYIFSGAPTGKVFIDNMYFYNGTTTSTPNVKQGSVKVYPNPAKSSLTISAQNEISAIRITNLVGQTIKNLSVNAVERVIDLNDMSNGQYIISLSMKNGQIVNQKFSKK